MNKSITKIAKVMNSATNVTKSPANSKASLKKAPTEWRDRISTQNYELLRQTFLIFDEDGSGEIDPTEISKVLEQLGLDKRNQYVVNIIAAMREISKKITFDDFVDIVCNYTGQVRTKDGLKKIFNLYDTNQSGVLQFEQIKHVAKQIGQHMTDDALLDLMHAVFINHQTTSNESISFQEFYTVISTYYNKEKNQGELKRL